MFIKRTLAMGVFFVGVMWSDSLMPSRPLLELHNTRLLAPFLLPFLLGIPI